MTSIKQGSNLKVGFAQALAKYKALGMLPKKTLPNWIQLSEYRCQMVIDQYQNQKGQTAEQCRLQFVHKRNQSTFSINIVDLNYVKNSSYIIQWTKQIQEDNVTVGDMVGYRMTVNSFNYKKPDFTSAFQPQTQKLYQKAYSEVGKVQEVYKKEYQPSVKSQVSKKKLLPKSQPLKKEQQMLQFDMIKHEQEEGSDFGSSIDQQIIQPKKKAVAQNPNLKIKMFNDYHRAYQQRNLIDYSQSTKISIRFKLLQFLKVPENRKRKIPEIRQFFRKNNYNVPQKPLKQLIKDLCVSNVMDRTKGFILKDMHLTPDEINKRQEQKKKQMTERNEQQKKKRSKKQPKVEAKVQYLTQTGQQRGSETSSSAVNRWASPKKSRVKVEK